MTLRELLTSEMDLPALFALARRGIDWWLRELAALAPAAWRPGLSARPRVFAARVGDGGWRFWRDGRPLAAPPAKGGVGLVLSEDEVLARRIEVPRMSMGDVRRMVALDIDRYSPLRADQVCFDLEMIDRDIGEAKQAVLLGVVNKAAAARLIGQARADGLSPACLSMARAENDSNPQFDFLPSALAALGEKPARNLRAYGWGAVSVLLLLNLALLVGRDMADVSRLRQMVDGERPAASAALRLRRRVEDEEARRRALIARGTAAEPLRMLEALTQAIPRGAWVQRLEWNGQTVRLIGFKSPDIDMAAAVRGSGVFTNPRSLASQASPPTRGGQPFDITADVRAQARP